MKNTNEKLRFAMFFSAGKDSTIALNHMIKAGHTPACLVIAEKPSGLTHMHNMRPQLVKKYEEALGIPIVKAQMQEKYDFAVWEKTIETSIHDYKIQAICTGDIAFPYSRDNVIKISNEYGIKTFTPLWGIDENTLIEQISDFRILIKSLSRWLELDELVGQFLTPENISLLQNKGLQLSQDTSDLHTLAVDGPIFKKPINYHLGKVYKDDKTVLIDVL